MSTISGYHLPVVNSLGALSIRSFCTFIFSHEILQLDHFISSDSCSCVCIASMSCSGVMARLSGDKTDDNFVGGVKGKPVNTSDSLFNFVRNRRSSLTDK